MRFDWQAYEDGSMDAASRLQADALLAESDQARLELESLRSFRATLREAATAEAVPVERLQASLKFAIASRRPNDRRRIYWTMSGVAAAAVLVAFAVDRSIPRISEPRGPVVAYESTVSRPAAVQDWLSTKTKLPVPEIRLTGLEDANIAGASSGKDWIAWKVRYCGQEYTMYGRKSRDWFDHAKEVDTTPHEFYVDGKHIGWYCAAGMAYMICGGTEDGRWKIAKQVCRETPSAVLYETKAARANL